MKLRNTRAAARDAARQILAGEFDLMTRDECSQLWFLICRNFREPGCPAAFEYLKAWLRRYNEKTYGNAK